MTEGAFAIEVETGWDPPSASARRWWHLRAAVDLLTAFTGGGTTSAEPVSNEPRWRVTLSEAGSHLATSRWSRDWGHVERVRQDWENRVSGLAPRAVRSTAHRWAGE